MAQLLSGGRSCLKFEGIAADGLLHVMSLGTCLDENGQQRMLPLLTAQGEDTAHTVKRRGPNRL